MVTAVAGLGEQLVSGEALGEEWTLRGEYADRTRDAGREPVLDPGQARAVAALARQVDEPALEQHIAGLRADRETAHAIGAATYVIDNLTAEIDAFTRVAEQMRRSLAALTPDEREEIEHAGKLLRRARAARQLLVIQPAPRPAAG